MKTFFLLILAHLFSFSLLNSAGIYSPTTFNANTGNKYTSNLPLATQDFNLMSLESSLFKICPSFQKKYIQFEKQKNQNSGIQTRFNNTFTLATIQGYGGGEYEKGDVIHIWARQIDGKVFTHWTGDTQYLDTPSEYHAKVTMPDKNITVTANYATLTPAMDMRPFTIRGAERNKNIFVYLPIDKNKTKGVVWFFHGTNGNANNMISDPDTRQLMNLCMVNDYGVVALTSEESEYDLDFNGDGVFRYTYGVDTNLVDIANVRAIRDTFINKGFILPNTKHAAVGWSAGGAFTEFIANALSWEAAINHSSPGNDILSNSPLVQVPYLLSLNENDKNPDVGQAGNAMGRENIQNYFDRGACAILHEQLKAPLYPERFDRSQFIDEATSVLIYNELNTNGLIDSDSYLKYFASEIALIVAANPNKFPFIVSLSLIQKDAILKQMEVTNADHSLVADINGLTLNLIAEGCDGTNHTLDYHSKRTPLTIIPNPVSQCIDFNFDQKWEIYNGAGRLILNGNYHHIRVEDFPAGLYIVKSDLGFGKFIKL